MQLPYVIFAQHTTTSPSSAQIIWKDHSLHRAILPVPLQAVEGEESALRPPHLPSKSPRQLPKAPSLNIIPWIEPGFHTQTQDQTAGAGQREVSWTRPHIPSPPRSGNRRADTYSPSADLSVPYCGETGAQRMGDLPRAASKGSGSVELTSQAHTAAPTQGASAALGSASKAEQGDCD